MGTVNEEVGKDWPTFAEASVGPLNASQSVALER